jgi:phenylalanyl-tRNA synthetase beta chain
MGIRPINNIVDSTNYIMLETGQPLHAFDKNALDGNTVIVRNATPAEVLITLDQKQRTLTPEMLVIADQKGPIALAGIMGGLDSEVTQQTTSIVLESANFEHYSNRKTSRNLGLQTEASIRFSKNQDPELTLPALQQTLRMILELAGGTPAELVDLYPQPRTTTTIAITPEFITQRIGDPDLVTESEIEDIFQALALTVEKQKEDWLVTPPTFRPDLAIPEDLVEEIARINGYDTIEPTLPIRDLTPAPSNPRVVWKQRLKTQLAQAGLTEVYNYSFVGKSLYERCNLAEQLKTELRNPISPEHAYLKPYVIPSLLQNIQANQHHHEEARLFELDTTFIDNESDVPSETQKLGLAYYHRGDGHAYNIIKGWIEHLLHGLHITPYTFKVITTSKDPITGIFHPQRRATILQQETIIGYVGELHPELQLQWGISGNIGLAELQADWLYQLTDSGPLYVPLSIHPQLTIDISCVVPLELSLDELRHTITHAGSELLVETIATQVHHDPEKFGEGKKAVTLRLIFQSPQKTLAKADIASDIENAKQVLTQNLGAVLRS